jgi:hypothetical protein
VLFMDAGRIERESARGSEPAGAPQ